VTERRMVADLYVFDLASCKWEKIEPFPEDDIPCARYFHSADTCMFSLHTDLAYLIEVAH